MPKYQEVLATGRHKWSTEDHGDSDVGCYFCKPQNFPPMPDGTTLCARCGNHIWIGMLDPMNMAMEVCQPCEDELKAENYGEDASEELLPTDR